MHLRTSIGDPDRHIVMVIAICICIFRRFAYAYGSMHSSTHQSNATIRQEGNATRMQLNNALCVPQQSLRGALTASSWQPERRPYTECTCVAGFRSDLSRRGRAASAPTLLARHFFVGVRAV